MTLLITRAGGVRGGAQAGARTQQLRRAPGPYKHPLNPGCNRAQVVCEEAPEPRAYGARTKQKQRFVAGVVTPAQPHYLYGLLDANTDLPLGGAAPLLAVAASATGYKVARSPPAWAVGAQAMVVVIWEGNAARGLLMTSTSIV